MPDSISIRVETNQPATMRDGAMLYADVYRPDGPGPFPTILQRHRVGLFALVVIGHARLGGDLPGRAAYLEE